MYVDTKIVFTKLQVYNKFWDARHFTTHVADAERKLLLDIASLDSQLPTVGCMIYEQMGDVLLRCCDPNLTECSAKISMRNEASWMCLAIVYYIRCLYLTQQLLKSLPT